MAWNSMILAVLGKQAKTRRILLVCLCMFTSRLVLTRTIWAHAQLKRHSLPIFSPDQMKQPCRIYRTIMLYQQVIFVHTLSLGTKYQKCKKPKV